MEESLQQALLMAQLNKKRELKQKYLYQSEFSGRRNPAGYDNVPASRSKAYYRNKFLRDEATKLNALCDVLAEQPEGLNYKALLGKEKQKIEKIYGEERAEYEHMSPDLKTGSRGEAVKSRLLLLGGAVKRLGRVIDTCAEAAPSVADLSEVIYLLGQASVNFC